jgi:phosphoserine phosphatase RsbU/P
MELACHYQPASPLEVGGDFYDVFHLPDGRWAFFLGDVYGKGAAASALTSLCRYTLRAAAFHDADPAAVRAELNSALLDPDDARSRFCTAVFGLIEPDPASGQALVTLGTSGHRPACRLRGDGTVDAVRAAGEMLAGAFPDATFAAVRILLSQGTPLVLYTDARTGLSEVLGEEGLAAFLHRSRSEAPPRCSTA